MIQLNTKDGTSADSIALFLFAHQDDEFGVFQQIVSEVQKGSRVYCAYLTDGGVGGVSPQRRNQESLYVLHRLGVSRQNVLFAGQDLGIPDGRLNDNLASAGKWISEWVAGFSQVTSVFVPSWEGGHHDHDALHAIVVTLAQMSNYLDRVRQFPLYNGYGCVGPFFRVLYPLPMNGTIEAFSIPWAQRLQFLRYCLCYPSQARTWIGLFPFVVLRYLASGVQVLQPVSVDRTYDRPHDGTLYYEKRGFLTWEKMANSLSEWRRVNLE